jgi:subtilisin-like proprotein convertase family protein
VLLTLLLGWAAAPIVRAQTTESFTYTTNRLVPDGNASGLHDVRVSSSAIGAISSLKVRLKIAGEFNGDMYAYLRHVQNGVTNISVLLNRSGATSTNPAGYAGSGFNVTFQDAAANGDIHLYQNVTNAASPLLGFWQPDGRTADPGVVTELSPRTASLTNFNGMNAAGEWTLYLADLASGGTNQLVEWGLDINGSAYPTVAWPNPGDVVYGTALGSTQLNETVTYGGNPVSGTIAYSPSSGTTLAAGASQVLTAVFTPTDSASFQRMTNTVTLNVQQAPLEITANNTNKVYGAANPVFTASYSGFVNGDTAANLGTQVTLATTANSASPFGSYPITASGAAGTNYSIRYVSGALAVNTATLNVAANATNKIFGASDPSLTYTVSGLQNSDTTNVLTGSITRASGENAGSYAISQGSLQANTNYTIAFHHFYFAK